MAGVGEKLPQVRDVWWQKWFVAPIRSQLTKGATVEQMSWTISLGLVLGIFPIMGTTTLLCLVFGAVFHLNHAVLQVFKAVVYPLHLAMILVFIRLGERLFGSSLISFSIPELISRFKASPLQFGRDFGLAAGQGICAWLLIAPVVALIIKLVVTPAVRQLADTISKRNGGAL